MANNFIQPGKVLDYVNTTADAVVSRWTYAGGKQLPGLVKRRAAERQLCEAGLG